MRRLEAVGADRVRELRMTDYGNSLRLVREHGSDLLHVPGQGWHVWDGKRWQRDDDGAVMRRAKMTVVGLFEEAISSSDRELAAWATKSAAEPRLRAAVSLAESEPPVLARIDELDADPWLLACANGTVDLRTGELRAHRREDMLTKLTNVVYDPSASCPTWDEFLRATFSGDADLIRFVQRAVGYSLTGLCVEHVLIFLHGLGANGKTTFLRTLLRLADEHAIQAEPDLLLVRHGDGHPTGVADLHGVRLAVCVEIDEGRRLAESLVKQLTGGDKVRARRMRRDFFEFEPTHTVWLAANHKPGVRGTDNAIWRRIKLVPFNVTIPAEQQDADLPDKLAAELPGVLNWAVRGCLDYTQHGLNAPAAVETATAGYRAEQDVLGAFIEECCVLADTATALASGLYNEYVQWAERNGEKPISKTALGLRLKERGLEDGKGTGGVRIWRRIGLRVASGAS